MSLKIIEINKIIIQMLKLGSLNLLWIHLVDMVDSINIHNNFSSRHVMVLSYLNLRMGLIYLNGFINRLAHFNHILVHVLSIILMFYAIVIVIFLWDYLCLLGMCILLGFGFVLYVLVNFYLLGCYLTRLRFCSFLF